MGISGLELSPTFKAVYLTKYTGKSYLHDTDNTRMLVIKKTSINLWKKNCSPIELHQDIKIHYLYIQNGFRQNGTCRYSDMKTDVK